MLRSTLMLIVSCRWLRVRKLGLSSRPWSSSTLLVLDFAFFRPLSSQLRNLLIVSYSLLEPLDTVNLVTRAGCVGRVSRSLVCTRLSLRPFVVVALVSPPSFPVTLQAYHYPAHCSTRIPRVPLNTFRSTCSPCLFSILRLFLSFCVPVPHTISSPPTFKPTPLNTVRSCSLFPCCCCACPVCLCNNPSILADAILARLVDQEIGTCCGE